MKIRNLTLAVIFLSLTTALFAQKANVDWDRKADFSKYHSYAWQNSPNPADSLWNQRIIDGIDQRLAAKGMTKVESNPDIWVVYSTSLTEQKQVVGPGWGWGRGWRSGIGSVEYNTYITQQGTLVVELADSNNHQLLWRGSATATISDKSDKNIKTLNSVLDKLFKNYPPAENN
jgi:hypothetical protein